LIVLWFIPDHQPYEKKATADKVRASDAKAAYDAGDKAPVAKKTKAAPVV
jgi:hypothetical protein